MPSDPPCSPPPELIELARKARRIVALTGAGMSAESGVPTFRDRASGLWARFDPQALATAEAFKREPELVWGWYEWRRRLVAQAAPNAGHHALRVLAALPWLQRFCVITQNVDDLHERARSTAVLHLHGSLFVPRCFACARPFALPPEAAQAELPAEPVPMAPPVCAHCGGNIRPGVVWFGESLPETPWREAMARTEAADLVLVVGTSGTVYPAASLPAAARRAGGRVAVLNPDPDAAGAGPDLAWPVRAAEGLPALVHALTHGAAASP